MFRMRRAFQVRFALDNRLVMAEAHFIQCSLSHQLLPVAEQTKPEEVRPQEAELYWIPTNTLFRTIHTSHL